MEQSVRLMQEEEPKLALLELVLPNTDDIEADTGPHEGSRRSCEFLSACGRDYTIARTYEMGAVDYVVKPFSPRELAARIGTALRRREVAEPLDTYVLGGWSSTTPCAG